MLTSAQGHAPHQTSCGLGDGHRIRTTVTPEPQLPTTTWRRSDRKKPTE